MSAPTIAARAPQTTVTPQSTTSSQTTAASQTAQPRGRFSRFVSQARQQGRLVVQPRMGFGEIAQMRAGLDAVRDSHATAIGTITVDSYTRVNDHESARRALAAGSDLNGFPVVAHGAEQTRRLLAGVSGEQFPVQFRHGSALPYELFQALVEVGADATEGGPVSYCLPYSRVPLARAVAAWAECCRLLADRPEPMHLESFGGCMLGQMCPPSLLIALSVLEGMFFREHGLQSISVSYAQQTHPEQDLEALAALRRLAGERLGGMDWHVVLYTYMGVFPRTAVGAFRILEDSVRLAVRSGTERLIVKTPAEAHRIPTIAENVDALEFSAAVAEDEAGKFGGAPAPFSDTGIYEEARMLIDTTLEYGDTVGSALVTAFARGHLDVPYCLHVDNANRSRADIDSRGRLRWSDPGAMPLRALVGGERTSKTSAFGLIDMLGYNERRFDREQLVGGHLKGLR
ncbi:methylaspartate mutase E subunit [Catenulispora acidiphila DSM 44928]|uniref:Methylaspartate mutase E subunit n=1 Tax=Catenulispora acidiphila (strain DSM 44928 / JCM 14897 / NBRC 102108 / NRRL B-24433 / ID139908) TaxID=479433 RepID=C7QKA3_CATAD|nr:methylaspartate mutase [Catenulispora acidiphila]ACU75177.1 methylaspartate mutase E subunit [Catenulispora acidiphila DSM 44928]